MKYVRLTLLWGALFSGLVLASSVVHPMAIFAETQVGHSIVYPVFRFFRGGAFASVTEKTLERIFSDQFKRSKVVSTPGLERKLARHLYRLCVEHRLDPAFVLSVIKVESSFRLNVVSSAGAIGLMQLMPQTAHVVARRNKLTHKITPQALRDPFLNLTLGVIYLRELRDRYSGLSPYYHLAAYNMGPHRLDQLRAMPGFKPDKSLKYYQDVMKGVNSWRFYGPKQELKEAAIQARKGKVKLQASAA